MAELVVKIVVAQPAFTCLKSTVETAEQCVKSVFVSLWLTLRRSGAFIANFEQIAHIVLVFLLLLTLTQKFHRSCLKSV